MNENTPNNNFQLQPFEYHTKLRDHFKSRTKTWKWFQKQDLKEKQIKEHKQSLLKNTYRLDEATHAHLYETAKQVCDALHIDAQVTLYQENNSIHLNAGIVTLGKEAHVVFSGRVLDLLSNDELKALFAHEFSHYLFSKIDQEEYENTQRILLALANDSRSEDVFIETARLFQLHLELFCDLGALLVCQEYKTVIQMLVKMATGLTEVNAESYLAQANEIIEKEDMASIGTSHPEFYIRSIALDLKQKNDPEYQHKIESLILGKMDMNKLDIFQQEILHKLTYDFIQLIVKPQWMASSLVLNLASQYFSDFYRVKEALDIKKITEQISDSEDSVKNYLAYILLDFTRVDSDLENAPLAHTLEISELLDIKGAYEKVLRKELKLTIREFKQLCETATQDLQNVTEAKEDSIYNE